MFNKALQEAIKDVKITGFPFASIRLEIGHTADLPAAVADQSSLLYTLLAQPWESVVFNVNRVSNFFLQQGYDFDAVVQALDHLNRREDQTRIKRRRLSDASPSPRRRLVSVGTDGFAVFALQDSDSQMYWEGL